MNFQRIKYEKIKKNNQPREKYPIKNSSELNHRKWT